jgi:acetylglutamate kinase
VLKVLAGSVNHELVAELVAAGARAVGLSGIDASLTEAEFLDPELGAVGRVVRSNPELLDLLVSNGYVPVVACVAGDRQGRVYNVNADQMAVACAAAFRAETLLFLTDVPGVLDGDHRLIPRLTAAEAQALIREGIATAGMQAKLSAAIDALKNGVRQIAVTAGAEPDGIARMLAGESIGTRIIQGSPTHD